MPKYGAAARSRARPQQHAFEDKVASSVHVEIDRVAKGIAAHLGPMPGSETRANATELEDWLYRDPKVVPDVPLLQQMIVGGQLTRWAATMLLYPHRKRMVESQRPHAEDQVRYAVQMQKKAEQAPPEPPTDTPMDQMPDMPPAPMMGAEGTQP